MVGVTLGDVVGCTVGATVGLTVGLELGLVVGAKLGDALGLKLGPDVGLAVQPHEYPSAAMSIGSSCTWDIWFATPVGITRIGTMGVLPFTPHTGIV